MPAAELSAAAMLVLRDGRRANGRDVLKLAIKELVVAGTWRIAAGERQRLLRGPRKVVVRVRGEAPPPGRVPLGLAHALVASGPEQDWGGVTGREVRTLARHIAKSNPKIREQIVHDADALDSIDSSFDSSFDSAFDSSFDSGFADGGGDGGGNGGGD